MTDENIIVLYDEEGSEVEFEFLDLVNFEDEEYVVLLPVEESDEAGEVVILKLEYVEGEEGETYLRVEDEATLLRFIIFSKKGLRMSFALLIKACC